MKRNCIFLLGCLIAASCTINRYYIMNDGETSRKLNEKDFAAKLHGTSTTAGKTIKYDKALPVVPGLSVIQDASRYNKEDKHTFPIYGDETAVAPPTATGKRSRVAIWCTKECTVVASLSQMYWDLHYFQQSSDSYIKDVRTGKKYYIKKSYQDIPLDMSYNIKGVSGEWIATFYVYPPLPKKCTVIDIIEGHVTDDVKNGASWGGGVNIVNTPVEMLQRNQSIIKFRKTRIIE